MKMEKKINQVVLYIAASLDGYIAKADHSLDWLYAVEGDGGDNGFGAFYAGIGSLVMGRGTYDELMKTVDAYPHAEKPSYVLTRSNRPAEPGITYTSEPIATLVPRLKKESNGDVWLVGGGQLVRDFLSADLIDRLDLAVIPNVLGSGIPLFPEGTPPRAFRLTGSERIGQIAMLHYEVKRETE